MRSIDVSAATTASRSTWVRRASSWPVRPSRREARAGAGVIEPEDAVETIRAERTDPDGRSSRNGACPTPKPPGKWAWHPRRYPRSSAASAGSDASTWIRSPAIFTSHRPSFSPSRGRKRDRTETVTWWVSDPRDGRGTSCVPVSEQSGRHPGRIAGWKFLSHIRIEPLELRRKPQPDSITSRIR